jgi:hypothetical protein
VSQSRGALNRAAMLERLERYAGMREAGTLPVDAARELGVSGRTGEGYERWYRRERLRLADRPPGYEPWRSAW